MMFTAKTEGWLRHSGVRSDATPHPELEEESMCVHVCKGRQSQGSSYFYASLTKTGWLTIEI